MEFKAAYEKANNEDSLFSERKGDKLRKDQIRNVDQVVGMLSVTDWQIIKPESKVLSATQSYLKSSIYQENYRRPPREYTIGHSDGHKNGRLERDGEVNEIIQKIQSDMQMGQAFNWEYFVSEWENLKPL